MVSEQSSTRLERTVRCAVYYLLQRYCRSVDCRASVHVTGCGYRTLIPFSLQPSEEGTLVLVQSTKILSIEYTSSYCTGTRVPVYMYRYPSVLYFCFSLILDCISASNVTPAHQHSIGIALHASDSDSDRTKIHKTQKPKSHPVSQHNLN